MHVFACPICGSSELEARNIDLTDVLPTTRDDAPQQAVEMECAACGWFGTIEQAEDVDEYIEAHAVPNTPV